MFFEIAHTSPNQVAIELNEQTWTYGELLMNVICIAHHLQLKIGDIVYQYVDRSLEMVCGLLGIMCAGGAYCPLSSTDPPMYVRALIGEIQGRCVLVHENTRERFSSMISEQIKMINLEHILLTDISEEVAEKTEIYVERDSPSFIICTSDTTGRNKIIVHTHASLIAGLHNLMIWDTKHGDKVLQVVASSWAIHLFEILMPLVIVPSGSLVLLPPKDNLNMTHFFKTIKDKQITILFINPSLLKVLLDYLELNNRECNETLERVRILWISGESSKTQHLAKIKSFSSQIRIFLMFGMSETSAAIGYEIEESIDQLTDLSILPIGCPLSEYRCLLMDESNDERIISPLDTNRIGQIYLAGAGLFQCYYNNPELTSRTRVIINNEEFFKTGDLARYNTKSELVHAGRIDFQIKIENQRIEPAEVEKTIIACCPHEISNCLVTTLSQDKGLLVAYVIGDKTQLDIESIRNYCKDHLRKHMVPFYFVVLDKFPLNANGKVDRKQLPLPSLSNNGSIQFVKADELLSSVVSKFDVRLSDRTVSKGNPSNA
ncbi:unnamed protein product [Rotaria sp. Silwood2]|nr:unnamed protein product [Rotaria sp. Silwood2]